MGLAWLRPGAVTCAPVEVPRTADGRVDLVAVARAGALLVLESAPGTPGTGRWSYAVVGTAGRVEHDGRTTWAVDPAGHRRDLGADAFAALDEVTAAAGATPDDRAAARIAAE